MILLNRLRLINWYAFNNVTVPIGIFTLIAGKNGNGKSVLLDAIKYALYGDTVFNKSTENKGSRTVVSYTRGLLDVTAGTYMRPADRIPNVYTHIVLEMSEAELNHNFILGTVIETDSGNGFRTQRYVIEDKTLDDIKHTYELDGKEFPYSAAELQKEYGFKMMDATNGLLRFMQRTGLHFNNQQLATFRRKLRSIMSYDPEAKIDQFIRENVLEEKKVDLSKLIEVKSNIDDLNKNFELIDKEITELDEIINTFRELKQKENRLLADDVKIAYQKYLECEERLKDCKRNMEIAEQQMKFDIQMLENLEVHEEEIRELYNNAREHLNSMDCAKAIEDAKKALDNALAEKERLKKEKDALCCFQTKINELLSWFDKMQFDVINKKILSSLTYNTVTKAEKQNAVRMFLSQIQEYRDKLIENRAEINNFLAENQKEQNKCLKIIDAYEDKRVIFSEIPEYVALKNEINREFTRRGINSEAKFAFEYVIGISDEEWRDAIEAYLGNRRYTILVEPEYYDIADDVLNVSNNKYAHLFNTKLLMKKDIKPEPDSVVHFIEVKNPVAKKYFEWQLGKLHATAVDKVRNYENAISKEGRVSVAMDSYFLRFDRIKFYCLGLSAMELNRARAKKNLEKLRQEYMALQETLNDVNAKIAYLDKMRGFFGDYNYDACEEYDKAVSECMKKEAELKVLEEAQKNNIEYMELVQRVEILKKELENIENERGRLQEDKFRVKVMYEKYSKEKENIETEIVSVKAKLQEYECKNSEVYSKAIEDYKKYVDNGKTGPGGPLKDRQRLEREVNEARRQLISKQATYNALRATEKPLPETIESVAEYQKRRERIWVDNRQEIQAKLKEQTQRYEEIFKNEFVLTILKYCETARNDIKLINAELANLKFKSHYEFDVKYVKDGSDYEKIIEYAKYLKEREKLGVSTEQMSIEDMVLNSDNKGKELEQEIKRIVNRITESGDKEQIDSYADYRNYMTYEILLTNDVLSNAKLSKQSGYNSGAEVQIPYMLILLSALLMIYNEKNNSTRLVFIDEPFAKMDPINVKIMLDFMKKQNLQMIFCAPDKTELIGNECDVILPVLRTKPDLMEIGIVKIH